MITKKLKEKHFPKRKKTKLVSRAPGRRRTKKKTLSLSPLLFLSMSSPAPTKQKTNKKNHIAALAGVRFTTWLEQCTAPYIDVMGEKSTTCTSPRKRGSRTICLAVPA